MANTCNSLEFLKGGTIDEATILHSDIVSSVVSNSVIKSSEIQQLTGVDEGSATTVTNKIVENITNIRNISNSIAADEISYKVIGEKIVEHTELVRLLVQTIAALPAYALTALADALAKATGAVITPTMGGATPVVCQAGVMPGKIAGNADYVLGAPTGWIQTENGAVPVYPYDPCGEEG